MANTLRTIVENDKGELRKLGKIAKKVESNPIQPFLTSGFNMTKPYLNQES